MLCTKYVMRDSLYIFVNLKDEYFRISLHDDLQQSGSKSSIECVRCRDNNITISQKIKLGWSKTASANRNLCYMKSQQDHVELHLEQQFSNCGS